tara:strand:+ start:440 stop:604 length:165 start_codon:yes stop_codon:yes gene_type:complete
MVASCKKDLQKIFKTLFFNELYFGTIAALNNYITTGECNYEKQNTRLSFISACH